MVKNFFNYLKAAASKDLQSNGSSVISLVQELDGKFTSQSSISSSMQQASI